jgi:glycosyltransferase involved in cell wall biosynthesis
MDFSEYDKLKGTPNIILPEQKSNKRFIFFIYIITIIILLFIILYLIFSNLNNSVNKKKGIEKNRNFGTGKMEINKVDNKIDSNDNDKNKHQNLLVDEKLENPNNNNIQGNLNIKKDKSFEQSGKINSVKKKAIKRNYIEGDIYFKENEELFLKYRKEILIKNNIFENNKITTQIVKNRLEELNSTKNLTKEDISIINNLTLENILNDKIKSKNLSKQLTHFLRYPYRKYYLEYFQFMENPKISVIIPVYNSQGLLNRLYKSIQEQSFKDIEIIFVDDCSKDNSANIINNFQTKDRRIVLLKNKVNRGPFYSRNKGALFARGEYIQFIDSDDFFLNDIFGKAYYTAKIKNIDIVQYRLLKNTGNHFYPLNEKTKDSIIYQPELSEEMYYGSGRLKQINYYIYNKIIKKDIFLKSLIYIGDETLKENLYIHEDLIQLFCLLRVANSLLYIDNVGYCKFKSRDGASLQVRLNNPLLANQVFHDISLELKLIYDKTSYKRKDKKVCYAFFLMARKYYKHLIEHITKGFELIDKVFNLLINSIYFRKDIRISFKQFKDKIMNNQYNSFK